MSDRAQFTTPRLVLALFVAVAVLAVVAAEVRDAVTAVDGPVAYCGLCHVDGWLLVTALLALPIGVGVLLRIRSGRWRR